MLSNFLNKYPNLLTVIEDSEVSTPFLTEIKIRVINQDFWINCLRRLTKTFPNVIFSRRYQTVGDKFGFNWSIIVPGPRTEEDLQNFCDEADSVLTFLEESPSTETVPTENSSDAVFYRGTRQIKDKEGKVIGEERLIRLPGGAEDNRSNFTGNTPRVFVSTESGVGAEMDHLKSFFRRS
jgi:hypothetical protein